MDIDRFWQLIDQARAAAGPEADRAIRDYDLRDDDPDGNPDRDYWDFDDDELRAFVQGDSLIDDLESAAPDDEGEEDGEGEEGDDEESDLTDPVAVALFGLLAQLSAAEIAAFDNTFEEVRAGADHQTLINAALLIEHGFLGDDSFDDFRAGLVALGRSTFEGAVSSPDSLAGHPLVREIADARDPRWLGREDMLFVASHAYAAVTGEPEITFFEYAESLRADDPEETAGPDAMTVTPAEQASDWAITDEAESRRRLPRLTEMFYERSMRNRQRALAKLGLQG
jgi:hypothetical protein